MKTVWFLLMIILSGTFEASAQEAGNVAYGNKTHKTSGVALGNLYSIEPTDSSEFDSVINPVTVEPIVQFTLYLKIKYQVSKDAN
jgi:hypothetical protein